MKQKSGTRTKKCPLACLDLHSSKPSPQEFFILSSKLIRSLQSTSTCTRVAIPGSSRVLTLSCHIGSTSSHTHTAHNFRYDPPIFPFVEVHQNDPRESPFASSQNDPSWFTIFMPSASIWAVSSVIFDTNISDKISSK